MRSFPQLEHLIADRVSSSPAEVLPKRYRGVGATLGAASGGLGALVAYLAQGAFIRDYPIVGWRYGFWMGAIFALLSGVADRKSVV